MRRVTAFAPAKINLALHVGAPREDGRHPLVSLAAFADVGDVVTLSEGPAAFEIDGPFAADLAPAPDNLVLRALALVAPGKAASVKLTKNLPVASGIGGGSSDAAAALRAARVFFGLSLSDEELAERAAALGADLPVCVYARAALMGGTGEEVEPVMLHRLSAVLVNPGVPLSTGAVYRRFDEIGAFGALDVPAALETARNDLEAAACALAPEVGAVLAALRGDKRARVARMSGSGATCFALTESDAAAQALADDLSARHPGWWVRAARLGDVDVTPDEG